MNSRENNALKEKEQMQDNQSPESICYKLSPSNPKIADDSEKLKYDARKKMYYRGEQLPIPIKNNSYSFWFKAAATVSVGFAAGFALYKAIKR